MTLSRYRPSTTSARRTAAIKMNRRWGGISPGISKKRRARLFVARPLLCAGFVLALLAFSSVADTGIEDPTCEPLGPGAYRIDFQASPGAAPVEVFASSQPDRIDSVKAVLTISRAPADVFVPERSGRIYFHLKPAPEPRGLCLSAGSHLKARKTFGTWADTGLLMGVMSAGVWCTAQITW